MGRLNSVFVLRELESMFSSVVVLRKKDGLYLDVSKVTACPVVKYFEIKLVGACWLEKIGVCFGVEGDANIYFDDKSRRVWS